MTTSTLQDPRIIHAIKHRNRYFWIAAILILGLISFKSGEEKKYPVVQTLEAWQKQLNGLGYISQQLRLSDLPSKNVSFIQDSIIAPLQMEIISQIQPQIAKDSVKTKPK